MAILSIESLYNRIKDEDRITSFNPVKERTPEEEEEFQKMMEEMSSKVVC